MAATEGIKVVFSGDATGVDQASRKASNALNTVKKSSGQATVALTDVSRVISDMPYGIRGVANNIEQLAGSLGRVNFKDFLKGLAGPGGMIVGLSLVTSLATAAEMKYGSLANAIDALTSSNSAGIETQRELNKAFEEAQGSVAGEISKINALLGIARDETLSRKARQEAIDSLNKEYDKYLPKLTQENINTQAVTQAVDNLTASLIRQAKARGLQDLIAKESQKQAELLNNSLDENLSIWDQIKIAAQSGGNAAQSAFLRSTQGARATGEQFQKSAGKINYFSKQLQDLLKEEALEGTLAINETSAKKGQDLLQQRINQLEQLKSQVGLLKKESDELVSLKIQLAIRDQGKLGLSNTQLQRVIDDYIRESGVAAEVPAVLKFNTREIPKTTAFEIAPATTNVTAIIEQAGQAASALGLIRAEMLRIQEVGKQVSDFLTNNLSGAFTSLFENIMSGGKNAMQQFGQAIAGVVKKLIAAAITAAIFSAIVGAATGGASFGGGATSFLGGFKSMFSQLGGLKLARGGITTGPTLAMIGDNPSGREAVIPLRAGERLGDIGGMGGNLRAEFQRDKMVIWLAQGEKKLGRFG